MSDEQRLTMNAAGKEAAKTKIDPVWDGEFIRRIVEEPATLATLSAADIAKAGVGANEVRTWIAAIAAGRTPMEKVVYEAVPEWITGMGLVASR
jgi:2,3-dihydroxyphenylpropionate 1,2-dioxygenase